MMIKKRNNFIKVAMTCCIMTLPLLVDHAWAQMNEDNDHRRHNKKEKILERSLEQLDLKLEQSSKISEIKSLYRPKMEELRKKIDETMDEMSNLMLSNPTESQAKAQHDKLQQLMSLSGDLRFEIIWKIHDILTPEQRTKFFQKMKMLREDRKKHHHKQKNADFPD